MSTEQGAGRSKPVLLVVHDDGAPVSEVAVPLVTWADCVFVVPPTEYSRKFTPLLETFGEVVVADSVEQAAERLRAYEPDGIITYCEQLLRLTAHLAELLGLRYHSRKTTEVLTDKWQQRAMLRAAGVDSIRNALLYSVDDWAAAAAHVGFPAVLKPVHGVASNNTFLVADAAAGLARMRELSALDQPGLVPGGGMVLEEYLVGRPCGPYGDYVSVEVAVHNGELIDLGVTGKLPMAPPFRETGRFWPSPYSAAENEELRLLARAAVQALEIKTGITHTEIKLTPEGPRLIEVNGRLGGGIQDLSMSSGQHDLIAYAARIALNEPLPEPPAELRGVHYQLLPPAPQRACEIVSVAGADEIRELDGVKNCRVYVKPGDKHKGGVATSELARIKGAAADHAALVRLVEECGEKLRFGFAFPGEPQPRLVPASSLGSL